MKDYEEIINVLNQKAKAFGVAFSTPDGKKVLEVLTEQFDNMDIMADTPERTAYNLGRRDVVQYINQMVNHTRKHDE